MKAEENRRRLYSTNAPLYLQIAEKLEEAINQNHFPSNKLSPEKELASKYAVSVITIKQSLNVLANKGLLYRRPRIGTFIKRVLAPESKPAGQKVLRWLKLSDLSRANEIDNEIKERFEFICPGWKLKIVDARDLTETFHPEMVVRDADIISMSTFNLSKMMELDYLVELDEIVKEQHKWEHYFPAAINVSSANGHVYALPRMMNVTALYCNETVLAEHGMKIRKDCTWEELTTLLMKLPRQRRGLKLWSLGYRRDPLWFWENVVWQNGGDVFVPQGSECMLSSQKVIDGLLTAGAVLDTLTPSRIVDLTGNAAEFFSAHKCTNLVCFMGTPFYAGSFKNAPDKWITIPLPTTGRRAAGAASYYLGINRYSTRRQQSLYLLELICGDYGQRLLGLSAFSMPAYIPAAEKHFLHLSDNLDASGFLEAAQDAHMAMPWVYNPVVKRILFDEVAQAFRKEETRTAKKWVELCDRLTKVVNMLNLDSGEIWVNRQTIAASTRVEKSKRMETRTTTVKVDCAV